MRYFSFRTLCKFALPFALALAALGASAQHDHDRGRAPGHYAYRYHDVHRFNHNELILWQGGRWNNTCFAGRCGWWWLSAGQWYFYTQPVYPYPLVVSGIGYPEPVVVAPAPVVIAPAPVVTVPAPVVVQPALKADPPPKFWYYCDNPKGYFPQVQNCATQFRQVGEPPAPQ